MAFFVKLKKKNIHWNEYQIKCLKKDSVALNLHILKLAIFLTKLPNIDNHSNYWYKKNKYGGFGVVFFNLKRLTLILYFRQER